MNSFKALIVLFFILLFGQPNLIKAQFSNGQIVFLKSATKATDLYLTSKNGATAQRTPVAVDTKRASNQEACKWKLEEAGEGWYYLRNVKSGLLLDVKGGVAKPGTAIWLWPNSVNCLT